MSPKQMVVVDCDTRVMLRNLVIVGRNMVFLHVYDESGLLRSSHSGQ